MITELTNLISTLTESSFKNLIKEFLKEKYKTPHVRIIDGPYDGGNDLEIFINEKEIKRNIQVTVQKTGFEAKLKEDLRKSRENVEKYRYQNSLDFYISQSISKDKKNDLILMAETEYGINLNIYDSYFLDQESDNYKSIKEYTYKSHKIVDKESNFKLADKQTKILFDVLTLNHNTVEIKRNFIHSYIFSFLYAKPESTDIEILEYLNTHLNNSLHFEYVNKELQHLRTKKCLISLENKSQYQLSDSKFQEISQINSTVLLQEGELIDKIEKFIIDNSIDCEANEIVDILYKLYRDNYTIDIEEVKSEHNTLIPSIKKTFNDLVHFFTKKNIINDKAQILAKDLLTICESNDFLNKLSSVYLFNNLYSSDELGNYINSKTQKLFLDTQILTRIICVLYNDKIEYKDPALQSIKMFLSTIDKFKDKVEIFTSYDYVDEVTGQLLEAVKLQRFLQLPFLSKLGRSKNVFYNTYLELKEREILDEEYDFVGFIEELLDIEILIGSNKEIFKAASEKISQILDLSNIKLIYHDSYANYLSIKREYEISLMMQSKERSNTATENDIRTILYLATKDYHIDAESGEYQEPFLITWDSAFYDFRKQLLNAHRELSYWYIYSPLKVVDRLSVMNFNLNPKSISLNIVALTENNFNFSSKTTSFIDVISNFFHAQDVSKIAIINKLVDLKNDTQNISENPKNDEFKELEEDNITLLLMNLKRHYHSNETKYKFDDLIEIFERPEYEKRIIEIFESSLLKHYVGKNLTSMYDKFDGLITVNKNTQNHANQ